jgi:phenylacetate-CoA ligase
MFRPDLETAMPEAIRAHQLARLTRLLDRILPANRFYAHKLQGLRRPVDWDAFREIPFTAKQDLVDDQDANPPFGSIATFGEDRYVTYHQTSGTKGRPVAVVDTTDDWEWWAECWQYVYAGAGVTRDDRIFFAFSFGPFIGFWSAYEGARRLGALTIPGGGLDTRGRLEMMRRTRPTVLLSTVTYALRLAEAARAEGVVLSDLGVRTTLHAGEPGASIPSVRGQVEREWNAACYDHAGATEIGAWAYPCQAREGLHVNEAEFIAEIVDPATGRPASQGDGGEVVLTGLGRPGWPVIRYRTGDLVGPVHRACVCKRSFLFLPGGLVGRLDDLMIVRGVNIYPSAIEAIVRRFDVAEFRIVRTRREAMEELTVEIEGDAASAAGLTEELRLQIGVRIEVQLVPPDSLPRFELKARRVVDRRDP